MRKCTFIVLIAAGLLLFLAPEAKVQTGPSLTDLPPLTNPPSAKNPGLDSALSQLAAAYGSGGDPEAAGYAAAHGLSLIEGDKVRVVVELDPACPPGLLLRAVEIMSQQIELLGGRVETTYRHLLQAVVPFSALEPLAVAAGVDHVRRPFVPRTCETSEGVETTGADTWINLPPFHADGKGVKVCILDIGFQGYESLLGKELPEEVTVRSFRSDRDIEAGEVHGAACAEIVHDMAPEADLYLVNFSTDVEQHSAVDWIIGQGVHIISYSIGWTNAGAGNGTGPICEDVDKAADEGLIWVGAAGNYARDHYEGTFDDPDHDGWHNFSGADEMLEFTVSPFEEVGAFLNWNDWGAWNGFDYSGSDQDYDLYLFRWNGVTWDLVASSEGAQTGTQWPIEEIYGYYSITTSTWGVAVREEHATWPAKLELFSWGNATAIEHNVPAGSLSIPADSPHIIAVGATDWSNDAYHTYSSRGPTEDGRKKPDFAAPSGVSTDTYGSYGFYGTSASTPHMAGAYALLKGRLPYTLEQIHAMLELRALDLGPAGKDNQFGIGRLELRR